MYGGEFIPHYFIDILVTKNNTKEKYDNFHKENGFTQGENNALSIPKNPLVRDSLYYDRRVGSIHPNEDVRVSRVTTNTVEGFRNIPPAQKQNINDAKNGHKNTHGKSMNTLETKDLLSSGQTDKIKGVTKPKPEDKKIKDSPQKKVKSGFKFWSIFNWGCKGKGKVLKPSHKPTGLATISNSKLRLGRKLGERDIKSECNAKSLNDDSLMTFYVKNKDGQVDLDKLTRNEERKYLKPQTATFDNRRIVKAQNTQKSREAAPDSDLSDMSESGSKDSREQGSPDRRHTNEDTNTPESEVSSFLSDKQREDKESNNSDDEQNESKKSSESDSSENSESSEEFKEVIKPRPNFNEIKIEENEKPTGFFQHSEQDEISGGCLPSFRNKHHISSDHHEITENNYHEKISKTNSSKRENQVGVPRRSTIMDDGKVWTIEEDEYLRIATEKFKISQDIPNWSKIAKEVNNYRMKNFFERTVDDCRKRFHEITKRPLQKEWTDAEIQK